MALSNFQTIFDFPSLLPPSPMRPPNCSPFSIQNFPSAELDLVIPASAIASSPSYLFFLLSPFPLLPPPTHRLFPCSFLPSYSFSPLSSSPVPPRPFLTLSPLSSPLSLPSLLPPSLLSLSSPPLSPCAAAVWRSSWVKYTKFCSDQPISPATNLQTPTESHGPCPNQMWALCLALGTFLAQSLWIQRCLGQIFWDQYTPGVVLGL